MRASLTSLLLERRRDSEADRESHSRDVQKYIERKEASVCRNCFATTKRFGEVKAKLLEGVTVTFEAFLREQVFERLLHF